MKKLGLLFLLLIVNFSIHAMESFVIQNIKFQGLQRLSEGTMLTYLPVKVGDTLDDAKSALVIRTLFKKGMFDDVQLKQEGKNLVVLVKERPSIQAIEITGNKQIKTEDLLKGLKEMGLATGEVLNPSLLNQVKRELERQYFNFGLYSIEVKTEAKEQPNNRTIIKIDIKEGKPARINDIHVVGNYAFEDKLLLKQFELNTGNWLSFFTKSNQYSKQKLSGDLETLRSYYLDRGYMDFQVESTQVTISPDKRSIYLTLHVKEGSQYTVTNVQLAGEKLEKEQTLLKDIEEFIPAGSLFSRQSVTKVTKLLTDHLGEQGHMYANINAIPDIDKQNKQVKLAFMVDPGKRIYVRRIDFSGNTKTKDKVLRREMRQLEGTWASTTQIERSRVRLERLGYFSTVTVDTKPVPGSSDQVDLLFAVVEQPSGNLKAAVGFAQNEGLLFNLGLSQSNFLGSGDSVTANFNNSKSYTSYLLEHTDPYFTQDGVSRTIKGFYRETDAKESNLTDYTKDSYGLAGGFGIPLSEHDQFRISLEYADSTIKVTAKEVSEQIKDFFWLNKDADGLTGSNFDYASLTLNALYSHDTRNRAIFPSAGVLHTVSAESTVPGGDLEYYKIHYHLQHYYPFPRLFKHFEEWVVQLRGSVAYGHTYGESKRYPFFENFYGGGIHSLRGFKNNSIGPREILAGGKLGDPVGGNLRILGGAEVFFPTPFFADKASLRTSLFMDAGNILETDFKSSRTTQDFDDLNAFRVSLGTGVTWLSPLGPLAFSLGFPINKEKEDDTQIFQFSFGAIF